MEIWKPVPHYEGYYEVSNMGRVRTVHHIEIRSNGWPYTAISKILKPRTRGRSRKRRSGYYAVALYKGNGQVNRSIHRLVALAFIPNPNNYKQVNHIDCNTFNNTVENLEWINNKNNQIHSMLINPNLKKCKRIEIYDLNMNHLLTVRSTKVAALIVKTNRTTVKRVALGLQKKCKSFKFKYAA